MPEELLDASGRSAQVLSLRRRLQRNYLDFNSPPTPDAHILMRARGSQRIRAWDLPRITGRGGPVFVLLHGLGAGALLFQNVIPPLRRRGRVLVIDLPGFSQLPNPRRSMSMGDFASATTMLLDNADLSNELDVDDPVIVGHSMGTQVAVELARGSRALGGRLVLVAPVMGPGMSRPLSAVRGFLSSSLHERPAAALVSVSGLMHAGLRWPARTLPWVLRYPMAERLSGIGGRLEIVRGTYDRLCPQEWAESLLNFSGASGSVRVAEGASHQVLIDHAEVVVQAALAAAGVDDDAVAAPGRGHQE